MRKLFSILTASALMFGAVVVNAQDDDKTYNMVELSYMKCKNGKDDAFKKAVNAHNAKYHPQGRHGSSLNLIATGADAGTYVWTMGPCMMKDLDDRPGKGAHQEDWQKNVDPFVESYGAVEYWKRNDKLSYLPENMDGVKIFSLWFLDIERGEYYRFKNIMANIQKVYEARGKEKMIVWENMFHEGNGRDVALEWLLPDFASLDNERWLRDEYKKMYGEDSWDHMMEEWEEVVVGSNRQLWTREDVD